MKYTFQHFIDISTSAESMQIINFDVGGADVIRRCAHLFNAYKYFKLGKVSVKFVPASTLPVDPLGMSYGDTDPQTVDPRDQLNPGLVRITNGEDLFTDLTNVSADTQEKIYQAMMLDPKWYKFNLQSGFKRSAVPLYWQVGQLHQDLYPGATVNIPTRVVDTSTIPYEVSMDTGVIKLTGNPNSSDAYGNVRAHYTPQNSTRLGMFQVGHRGRLGYLPTDAFQEITGTNAESTAIGAFVHPAPSIQVITAVLPKAIKTLYYYRVYITETVYFSGLRSIAPFDESSGLTYRGIDNFIQPPQVSASSPVMGTNVTTSPPHMNDGSWQDSE